MPSRDLEFVGSRVAVEPDHLHTVEKRLRDRVDRVRRADEHDVGKIVRHIHIVVRKRVVLLRIEHFEQRTRRISVVRDPQLIHFVEHHDRIGNTALLDPVHDPAGHRSDISPAVAADIRLIPHAAEADADIFPVQRFRNALSDTCLAGARCADKQEDRTRLLFFEIHDRDLLNNTLLDLFESEVVLLKHLLRLLEIDLLHLLFFPVQPGDKIQIIIEHARLRAAVRLLLEPAQHLECLRLGRFVHPGLFDLELEFADIRHLLGVHFIEFPLQELHLLFDRGLLVDLLIILLLRAGGLGRHFGDFHELIDCLLQHFQSLLVTVLCQNIVFLRSAHLEPDGHGDSDLTDRMELFQISHRLLAPFKSFPVFLQICLEPLEMRLLYTFLQIFDLFTSRYRQFDRVIGIDPDDIEIDPSGCPDDHISFRIDFIDKTGHTDREKAVLRHILAVLLFFA